MALSIRQEINILDRVLSAAGGSSATSSEAVLLDLTKFVNPTCYFEVVADSTVSISFNVTLRRSGTSTDDATCNVPLLTTAYTLIRSSSFVPPIGNQEYVVFIDNTAGATKNVKAARIVVIDAPATSGAFASTETQIELCGTGASTTTGTTSTPVTNPKYWKYTSANWPTNLLVQFEATLAAGNTKSGTTARLQVADGTGDGFTGWTDVSGSDVTTTSTTPGRVRSSGTIALTAGRNYRVAFLTGTSKSAATIYNAKIIIQPSNISNPNANTGSNFIVGVGSSTDPEKLATNFQPQATTTVYGVYAYVKNIGSPTDNIQCDIFATNVSGLPTGSTLGTSNLIAASVLTTSYVWTFFQFASPVSVTSGTIYSFVLSRTGTVDHTNCFSVSIASSPLQYGAGGGSQSLSSVWSALSGSNAITSTVVFAAISNLEPQYLLLNTIAGAGTGLQTYLTKWDSSEWSGVTNTYKHAADAANNSTSVIELDTAGGTQVTGSVVTSPDNEGISSALTMPSNGNLDLKVTTNNGDVYSSKILVAMVVNTIAQIGGIGGYGMSMMGCGAL